MKDQNEFCGYCGHARARHSVSDGPCEECAAMPTETTAHQKAWHSFEEQEMSSGASEICGAEHPMGEGVRCERPSTHVAQGINHANAVFSWPLGNAEEAHEVAASDDEAAFESAWSEVAEFVNELTDRPEHMRRIGHILFIDGLSRGKESGVDIAMGALAETYMRVDEPAPTPVVIRFNGREICASRNDTLEEIIRTLAGEYPGSATATVSISGLDFSTTTPKQNSARDDRKRVTVVHAGRHYVCSLDANDDVEVRIDGELIAVAEWATKSGGHTRATFVSTASALDDSELATILDHASDAWRKHRR